MKREPLSAIRQVWRSAFGSNRVAYLSGPITTGRRFLDWWQRDGAALGEGTPGYASGLRAHVIRPNEDELKAVADHLRTLLNEPVIEPASLFISHWSQHEYLELWEQFITDHASRILLIDGWEFSAGCASEFCRAQLDGVRTERSDGTPVVASDGIAAIRRVLAEVRKLDPAPTYLVNTLESTVERLAATLPTTVYVPGGGMPRKDQSLDHLAELINVAQFASFEPVAGVPIPAYSRVSGESPNHFYSTVAEAAEALLARSADGSVNIRSFTQESPLSREFIYGLTRTDDVTAAVHRLSGEGLHTIINETVDIRDGGVSGVVLGGLLEFAPDDTPRAVEKPGTASLPLGWGLRLLATVYGFEPALAVPANTRLEFSLHPRPRGWRQTHTLGWEISEQDALELPPAVKWPNRFSRMIGDKVFGLLVAHHIGLPVPRTTVINRRVAPFSFGQPTGSAERWFRTAPTEQMPGKFTTTRGWQDPFRIMAAEDPLHELIASVISQAGVVPKWSGASIVLQSGEIITEGVPGSGDAFMLGIAKAQRLPSHVLKDVEQLHQDAKQIGPVRFEWVHDGGRAWAVQLHRGATVSTTRVLVPGSAERWSSFDVSQGLDALRDFLAARTAGDGIELIGEVGLTSHIADVIRKANVPARTRALATQSGWIKG